MKLSYLIFLFISFTFKTSQKVEKDHKTFYLFGHINGRDSGLLILSYYNNNENWIQDTTYLEKGNFKFQGEISQPTSAILKGYHKEINFDEANYVVIFLEPAIQHISLVEDDYRNAKMEGSKTQKENDLLTAEINNIKFKWKSLNDRFLSVKKDFMSETDTILKNKKKQEVEILFDKLKPLNKEIINVVISFVKRHPDSYVSAYMLFNPINILSLDSAKLLYSHLSYKIRNSRNGKLLADAINKKEQNASGMYAPAFTATGIRGDKISLSKFRGKVVLLDFWASWCIPCRKEIPSLKKLYDQYHSKGFEIIGISIDKHKNDWEKAVAQEKISNWYNVLVNEEINKNYENVNLPIPSGMLINKSGEIIWKSANENDKHSLESILAMVLGK